MVDVGYAMKYKTSAVFVKDLFGGGNCTISFSCHPCAIDSCKTDVFQFNDTIDAYERGTMSVGALYPSTLKSEKEVEIYEKGLDPSPQYKMFKTRFHTAYDIGLGAIYFTPGEHASNIVFICKALGVENRRGFKFTLVEMSNGVIKYLKLLLGDDAVNSEPQRARSKGLPLSYLYDMHFAFSTLYTNAAFAKTELDIENGAVVSPADRTRYMNAREVQHWFRRHAALGLQEEEIQSTRRFRLAESARAEHRSRAIRNAHRTIDRRSTGVLSRTIHKWAEKELKARIALAAAGIEWEGMESLCEGFDEEDDEKALVYYSAAPLPAHLFTAHSSLQGNSIQSVIGHTVSDSTKSFKVTFGSNPSDSKVGTHLPIEQQILPSSNPSVFSPYVPSTIDSSTPRLQLDLDQLCEDCAELKNSLREECCSVLYLTALPRMMLETSKELMQEVLKAFVRLCEKKMKPDATRKSYGPEMDSLKMQMFGHFYLEYSEGLASLPYIAIGRAGLPASLYGFARASSIAGEVPEPPFFTPNKVVPPRTRSSASTTRSFASSSSSQYSPRPFRPLASRTDANGQIVPVPRVPVPSK